MGVMLIANVVTQFVQRSFESTSFLTSIAMKNPQAMHSSTVKIVEAKDTFTTEPSILALTEMDIQQKL